MYVVLWSVGSDGQSVLVVCVPSFDLTHSAVLVTLRGGGCGQL